MEWGPSATEHSFAGVDADSSTASQFDPSPRSSVAPHFDPSSGSSLGFGPSSNGGESKHELRAASRRMARGGNGDVDMYPGTSASSSQHRTAASSFGNSQPTTDEQMFDSLIEENSFGPPSQSASDYAGSPSHTTSPRRGSSSAASPPPPPPEPSTSSSLLPPRNLSSIFGAMQIPSAPQDQQHAQPQLQSALQVKAEPEASSSKGSNADTCGTPIVDGMEAAKAMIGREPAVQSGSEGEVAFSASTVVRPEVEGLADLQIHVHGIAARGAKSRVETQIKAHLELVKPSQPGSPAGSSKWDRVGSFTHLKLPPLSATKRKSKKNQQQQVATSEIPKEKTLYLDVAVVNASPPHQRAFACQSCSEREKKRADRRKSGRSKSGPAPTEEEMRKLGVDPAQPNAAEVAAEKLTQAESQRIILFNCGDYLEFNEGHAELPTRITCYCRHHKEKVGFCILFTMRNWKGKTVACGSTPAIMITDDHKSSAALERSRRDNEAAAAAATASASSDQQSADASRNASMSVDRSRATSIDTDNANGAHSGANRGKARKHRPKPYDSSRRSTVSSANGGFGMTPMASHSAGPGSPNSSSPPPGAAPPLDLIQALAAIGGERNLQQQAAQQQFQGQNPMPFPAFHQHQQQQPHQQQQQQNNMPMPMQSVQQLHPYLAEGSMSPDTLVTNPLSLPGLDFNNSMLAQQMIALLSQQGLVPRGVETMQSPMAQPPAPSEPIATISKVIPGEGPVSGGIEVTLLGENFSDGLTAFFGDLAASSTRVWASNTLICVLPASPSPGPVAVSLKTAREIRERNSQGNQGQNGNGLYQRPLQLFTYVDKSDTQLMELALQVVGFQQTRTMQVPREIALRLLASGQGSINSSVAASQGHSGGSGQQHQLGRDAVMAAFRDSSAANAGARSFQDTMINFLDVLGEGYTDAARLANKNGHTLLHLAVILGFHRLLPRLLEIGCPLDAKDRNGLTALHLAALYGRLASARVLLDNGARTDLFSAAGQRAMDVATSQDCIDVAQVLLAAEEADALEQRDESSAFDSDSGIDQIDDDNVSTTNDADADADDEDWTSDEDSDDSDSDDQEGEVNAGSLGPAALDVTPRPPSTPVATDVKVAPPTAAESQKSDEKKKAPISQDNEKAGLLQNTVPLRALTNKLPGGLGFLHDRLLPHSLQQRMQAVSVFQMMAPQAGASEAALWAERGSNGSKSGEAGTGSSSSGRRGGRGDKTFADQDGGRLLSLWRNITETASMAQHIHGSTPPPPAYEEADESSNAKLTRHTMMAGSEDQQQAPSRVSSPAAATTPDPRAGPPVAPGTSSNVKRPTMSSKSLSSSSRLLSTPAGGSGQATTRTTSRRSMGVEDDWMLRWFWLPCLFAAFLVAFFTTGPLSLQGLATYVPQLGGEGTHDGGGGGFGFGFGAGSAGGGSSSVAAPSPSGL